MLLSDEFGLEVLFQTCLVRLDQKGRNGSVIREAGQFGHGIFAVHRLQLILRAILQCAHHASVDAGECLTFAHELDPTVATAEPFRK